MPNPANDAARFAVRNIVERRLDIRSLVTARSVAATALFALVVVVLAMLPNVVGDRVSDALAGLAGAQPVWLWLAAICFVGSFLSTAWAWRAALRLVGGRLSYSDAAARWASGSLVNSFSPVRAGEAVRLALFARALPRGDRGWRPRGAPRGVAA